MRRLLATLPLLALALWGCTTTATFDDEPHLELLSVAPMQVVALQDSIVFQLRYQDGDGDLGTANPDSSNLFVVDNRLNLTHPFRVQALGPGTAVAIAGTLNVVLPNTVIQAGQAQETVTFTLYMVDQAGHTSNRVTTDPLTVTAN